MHAWTTVSRMASIDWCMKSFNQWNEISRSCGITVSRCEKGSEREIDATHVNDRMKLQWWNTILPVWCSKTLVRWQQSESIEADTGSTAWRLRCFFWVMEYASVPCSWSSSETFLFREEYPCSDGVEARVGFELVVVFMCPIDWLNSNAIVESFLRSFPYFSSEE